MTIHAAPSIEVIRCYRPGEGFAAMDAYLGCTQVTYLPPRVAMITGMHGKWSRGDMLEMFQHIHSHGIPYLLAEREPGHLLPWGAVIERGGFVDGLWGLDLMALIEGWDTRADD